MSTTTASATSMNFIGFDEMRGNGTPDILYNRVIILPTRPETAGAQIHPVAGSLPGQQPYIKRRQQIWNKSKYTLIRLGRSRCASTYNICAKVNVCN